MKLDCIVIQFARFPQLGAVKTRLQPTLGEQSCYELHQHLVKHVHDNVKHSGYFQVLSLNQLGSNALVESLALTTPIILQQGEDLGARMQNAIEWGLNKAKKVIIIGSDCVVLKKSHIERVVDQLNTHSHVLIPAEDGGYVLLGTTENYDAIFEGIEWGTDEVLLKTKRALESGNKKAEYLPPLWDVDRAEDYERLLDTLSGWPNHLENI